MPRVGFLRIKSNINFPKQYVLYIQTNTLLETEKQYYIQRNAFTLKYTHRVTHFSNFLDNVTLTNDRKFGYLFHFLTTNVRIKIYLRQNNFFLQHLVGTS